MARVLLIDPDRASVAALQKALAAAGSTGGAGVAGAPSASPWPDRAPPDIIVSRARIPDIDGYELCGIVRSDPTLIGVLFVVLADVEDNVPAGAFDEGGADRILVGTFSAASVVTEIRSLLAARTVPEPEEETAVTPQGPSAALSV